MATCRWCGDDLPVVNRSGRRREFCDQLCRNRLFGRVRSLEEHRNYYAELLPGYWDEFEAARSGEQRAAALGRAKAEEGRIAAYDAEIAELRRPAWSLRNVLAAPSKTL